jgi:radical SAM/Cys-rich protein
MTESSSKFKPFAQALDDNDISLTRDHAHILQINTGLLCDLACKHCHLDAGPHRHEVMERSTMDDIIAFAARGKFNIIDITGGAPELVPDLDYLLRGLRPLTDNLMLRTNLTALTDADREKLLNLLVELKVALVASFPSTSPSQTDAQRGSGVMDQSIAMLRKLNALGYGKPGSRLELNLVANPAGAFLPADQVATEQKFKRDAERKWGITFNSLFTFANVPLGRFRRWLEKSGNLDGYLLKLANGFNPCTVDGLMCKSLISVAWDGTVYDCDFNLAAGIPLGGQPRHVSELTKPPGPDEVIATGDHCYACTAGSGFT